MAGILVASGCIFSPDKGEKPDKPADPYLEPISPEYVLEDLRRTWQNRDSTMIEELYDVSYEGTSTDLADPTPEVLTFTWVNERNTVGALRRSPTVSSVFLDFGPMSSWVVLSSDNETHPEWAVIQLTGIRILITDGSNTYDASSGSDVITFRFQPYPDSNPTTGKRWRIIQWEETRTGST